MDDSEIKWRKIYTPEDLAAARAAPKPEPVKRKKGKGRKWWPGKK